MSKILADYDWSFNESEASISKAKKSIKSKASVEQCCIMFCFCGFNPITGLINAKVHDRSS